MIYILNIRDLDHKIQIFNFYLMIASYYLAMDLKGLGHFKQARRDLFIASREFQYSKNDFIIRSGDVPSGVYYIQSGWVQIFTICDDGEPNILFTLYPGDIFPLEWATTGYLRDLNFSALSDTKVLRITRNSYVEALNTNPIIMNDALNLLSEYSYCFTEELDNLRYRTAKQRVCYRLFVLASHFGERVEKGICINQPVSNEYIARSTNMTRETASREISSLTRQSLIKVSGNLITIADISKLRKLLHSDNSYYQLDGL